MQVNIAEPLSMGVAWVEIAESRVKIIKLELVPSGCWVYFSEDLVKRHESAYYMWMI